jgi:hypothetical protein
MKSPSIERLYAQLNKHILLVQSYTEVNEVAFIIKACRLKPHSFVFQDRATKLVLHRWWFDEFGNSLHFIKNKKMRIIYNDLNLDRSQIVCTDLYYGLSVDKIAKMSKLMFLSLMKEDETYHDQIFITFLGLDNYLRSYVNLNGSWLQVSPLCLGMRALKNIARNLDLRYFRELISKENAPLPCASARTWLSSMPPGKEFLQLMTKEYNQPLSFLNNKGII